MNATATKKILIFLLILSIITAFFSFGTAYASADAEPVISEVRGAKWEKIVDESSFYGQSLQFTNKMIGFVVNPKDPNVMYVGSQYNFSNGNDHEGPWKSIDGGKTWEKITNLDPQAKSDIGIRKIIINPDNPNEVLFAAEATVYRSTDAGNTWTKSIYNVNGDGWGNLKGFSYNLYLAAYPDEKSIYCWTTSPNLKSRYEYYCSHDFGITWEKISDLPKNDVFDIFTDQSKFPDGIYSGNFNHPPYGVSASTTRLDPNIDLVRDPKYSDLIYAPLEKDIGRNSYATSYDGIYITPDDGVIWYKVPHADPSVPQYSEIIQTIREENATVLYLNCLKIEARGWTSEYPGAGVESIWKLTIPDYSLESIAYPSIWLQPGSKEIVFSNGQKTLMDVTPFIKDGTTYVPVRAVAEAFGADVSWIDAQKMATISRGDDLIKLWLNQNTAEVNGAMVPINSLNPDVKLIVMDPGRIMSPLRFVGESLGFNVFWLSDTKEILITMSS